MDHHLDSLARAAAEGQLPRRELLRRVGGAAVGAFLASIGLAACDADVTQPGAQKKGPAGTPNLAADSGNADCVDFCQQAFPPGPERGQCIAEAAQGTGLCVECAANIGLICIGRGGQRFCCARGLNCCGDTCADLQNDVRNCGRCGIECPAGYVCSGGACICRVTCDRQCCDYLAGEVCCRDASSGRLYCARQCA